MVHFASSVRVDWMLNGLSILFLDFSTGYLQADELGQLGPLYRPVEGRACVTETEPSLLGIGREARSKSVLRVCGLVREKPEDRLGNFRGNSDFQNLVLTVPSAACALSSIPSLGHHFSLAELVPPAAADDSA